MIENIFKRFEFVCEKTKESFTVTVPARRPDITLEIDLIEEIMRVYGVDRLPTHDFTAPLQTRPPIETCISMPILRRTLCDLSYHEVITYSFVDKNLQLLLNPAIQPKPLVNPITAEMDVMRTNLWPGLIKTLLFNQNRQQNRVRLFESGLCFHSAENTLVQERMLAGLIAGDAFREQWGMQKHSADFFDLKGDLQNLFQLTLDANTFTFKKDEHPALHPGQTAAIFRDGQPMGIVGALHPAVLQKLDVPGNVFVFELKLDRLEKARLPNYAEVSKFPEIRRDLALIVDQSVPVDAIQATITEVAKELLKDIFVFDVYQGKGIAEGHKSIALALTLQHSSRTLLDEEVADLIERVIVIVKGKFHAQLRG